MALDAPDTDLLLDDAGRGDTHARQRLLNRHRERLLKMVSVRLDPRLAARVDPSERDREVLVLRYLEHLSKADTAAVLEITPGAANMTPDSGC